MSLIKELVNNEKPAELLVPDPHLRWYNKRSSNFVVHCGEIRNKDGSIKLQRGWFLEQNNGSLSAVFSGVYRQRVLVKRWVDNVVGCVQGDRFFRTYSAYYFQNFCRIDLHHFSFNIQGNLFEYLENKLVRCLHREV